MWLRVQLRQGPGQLPQPPSPRRGRWPLTLGQQSAVGRVGLLFLSFFFSFPSSFFFEVATSATESIPSSYEVCVHALPPACAHTGRCTGAPRAGGGTRGCLDSERLSASSGLQRKEGKCVNNHFLPRFVSSCFLKYTFYFFEGVVQCK